MWVLFGGIGADEARALPSWVPIGGPASVPARDLIKHHSLIAVDQNPVLQMPTDGLGEHALFEVTAIADQILYGLTSRMGVGSLQDCDSAA